MPITQFFFTPILLLFALCGALAQSTALPNVRNFEIQIPELQTSRRIWVYLPDGYTQSEARFPVLYLHDGQNVFDKSTSYSAEWRADEILDSLKTQLIVVAIDHGGEKRIAELTPFANEKYGGGAADAYLEFLIKTIKPEIDKKYRTKPQAANTGIMGSSLGGLVSFYAVLKHPKVFGKAGIFSPSFWFSDAIYKELETSESISAKMFFLCGDSESEDMVRDMNRMTALIKSKYPEIILTDKIIPNGRHNEKLWSSQFADCVQWLFN